jgi:hypothetical protein
LLGTDCSEIKANIKNDISMQLLKKGNLRIHIAYDKAAKALADNFNAFINSNKYSSNYKI